MRLLQAVEDINDDQKKLLFHKLEKEFKGELKGKNVTLWGLAFKPETDDMREAPSLVLIEKLLAAGCNIRVYDPVAMEEAKRRFGDKLYYSKDIYDAVVDADALILVTEWKEFRLPSWPALKKLMNCPVLLDGRNIYEPEEIEEYGFVYHRIGR
jgi:UDPglucose 6-dehydrogenase